MATITLTIPNPVAQRVLDAISSRYGYSATLPDGSANPQTKTDFLKAWIIRTMKEAITDQEAHIAATNAEVSVRNDVNANILIT